MGRTSDFPQGGTGPALTLRPGKLSTHLLARVRKIADLTAVLNQSGLFNRVQHNNNRRVNTPGTKSRSFKCILYITHTCAVKGYAWSIYGTRCGGGGSQWTQHYRSI